MLGKDGAPVYRSSALVQNSQTIRALSYRWRDYPEKCRSKPVISRTKLADNSCDTSIRQLVRCRIDVVATRRNVVVLKPVISRHYTVLYRSKSHGTRHNSHSFGTASANFSNQVSDVCKAYYYVRNCSILFAGRTCIRI